MPSRLLLETDKVRFYQDENLLYIRSSCCDAAINWRNRGSGDPDAYCMECNKTLLTSKNMAIVVSLFVSTSVNIIEYWVSSWMGIDKADVKVEVKK